MKRVLNVGGASKDIPIPSHYGGWDHVLLDIDPSGEADVVCDARNLADLPAGEFDAIYCSHNLEHYWRHDLATVLSGFVHVLRPDGFAEVRVPDLTAIFAEMQSRGLDIDDTIYQSAAGPITPNDVIYGLGREIAESGNDFYAHKNGFTAQSLARALTNTGFARVATWFGDDVIIDGVVYRFEIRALAFMQEPTPDQRELLGIKS